MNRLFFSVSMSMIILFAWWGLVGYMQFGADISTKHLDLYSMIYRFKVDFNYQWFNATWNSFIDLLESINDTNPFVRLVGSLFQNDGYSVPSGFAWVLNAINALFNPIAQIINLFVVPIYLILFVLPILGSFLQVTSAIVDFVISPVFI